jgi:molybdopterin molybdotransferase
MQAALQRIGMSVDIFHVPDDKNIIAQRLKYIIRNHDVIIISGGVSRGKFDFVPAVLQTLGIEAFFQEIAQRPARHLWFGAQEKKKVVFGVSGNPVSTFMSFHVYIKPFLLKLLGGYRLIPQAILTQEVIFEKKLTCFIQVKVSMTEYGELLADPVIGSGSGDLTTLYKVDGFLELPQSSNVFRAGEKYPLYLFKPIFY